MSVSPVVAPKISIIVPVYNSEAYVGRCLESILAQSYRNIEVIIIDDGSTDASSGICRAFASRDERIIFLHQGNRGQSAARNAGLDCATGDYVTFVDSDDFIASDTLRQYVNWLAHSSKDIVISGYRHIRDDNVLYEYHPKFRVLGKEEALEELYRDNSFQNFMWNKLYKRTLFDAIRFPEGKVYEDISVQYKLFETATTIITCPLCGYYYVVRRESTTNENAISNILDSIEAHLDRFDTASIRSAPLLKQLAWGIFTCFVQTIICGLINARQVKDIRTRRQAVNARLRRLMPALKPYLGYYYYVAALGVCGGAVTDIFVGLYWVVSKMCAKLKKSFHRKSVTTPPKGKNSRNWLAWLPGCSTDGSWILLDRDTQADDNAEHLYRWLRQHHPEQRVYFALRRKSHDWSRLAAEGFDLIDISNPVYLWRRLRAMLVVSSHADDYIYKPASARHDFWLTRLWVSVLNRLFSLVKRDCFFVFLQHGVTQNNIADWLNSEPISLLCAATPAEYQAFVSPEYGYRYTEKDTQLTGFPRHDVLVPNVGVAPDRPQVTIMPTWRSWLLGEAWLSNSRPLNADFIHSHYARAWQSFLTSDGLFRLQEKYGFSVVFWPHANFQPYLSQFDLPPYIYAVSEGERSIQEIFLTTSILVTDYSSVAFEMAFLLRSVIYYQFDAKEFFNGKHVCTQGYFNYEREGFGPVVTMERSLLDAIAESASHGFAPRAPYLKRMRSAFPYRDGNNCERVYKAILNMFTENTNNTRISIYNYHT